jgi:hypothetical protein
MSTITVTNIGDTGPGTLRAAIEQANLDAAQDTIDFAPSVTGTIMLSSALPNLSTSMIIAGPGPTALTVARSPDPATPEFRVFGVAGVEVSISGLTITGGREHFIGGIGNTGTLTLTNCTLSGNTASGGGSAGGGIANSEGTLTLTNCTVSDNSASGGRAARIFTNNGKVTVTNSIFANASGDNLVAEFLAQFVSGGAQPLLRRARRGPRSHRPGEH